MTQRWKWLLGAMVVGMIFYVLLGGSGCSRPVVCDRDHGIFLSCMAAASQDASRAAYEGNMPQLEMQLLLDMHARYWRAMDDAQHGKPNPLIPAVVRWYYDRPFVAEYGKKEKRP